MAQPIPASWEGFAAFRLTISQIAVRIKREGPLKGGKALKNKGFREPSSKPGMAADLMTGYASAPKSPNVRRKTQIALPARIKPAE